MRLTDLTIFNYKNIAQAELSFSPKLNCFIGNNGEGKTNLLDAIHFLSFCRSYGSGVDMLTVRHGCEFMSLQGRYEHEDGTPEDIHVGLKVGQKKVVRRGKKAYRRISEHIGLIPLVMVSPADQILVIDHGRIAEQGTHESLMKQVSLNVVGDGGSLQPNADTAVTCGESLSVTITPSPCHIIQSVQVNGEEWTGFNPAGDVYTFSNIRGDSSLTATFAVAQDTIMVTANNQHGTVTSLGENVLDCGSDFSVTITPDDCYRVGSVRVDGVIHNDWLQTIDDSKVLTLNDIVENHSILVNFNQLNYLNGE